MRKRIAALFLALVSVAPSVLVATEAYASSTCLGGAAAPYSQPINYCQGFLNGDLNHTTGWDNVISCPAESSYRSFHNVFCDGLGSNPTSLTDKALFIAFIKDKMDNGTAQEKKGASFIIYTLLGMPPDPAGGGTLPILTSGSAVYNEFVTRINYPSVTITWESFSYLLNSAYLTYSGPYSDDAFVYVNDTDALGNLLGPRPGEGLVFRQDGNIVYKLNADCANPVGQVDGIKAKWKVAGQAYANGASSVDVYPGDIVTFTYTLKEIGGQKDATNVPWSTNGGSSGTVANIPKNTTTPILVSETVTAGAPGTIICRHITYQQAEGSAATANSADACMTVKSNYDLYPKVSYGAGDLSPITPGSTAQMTQTVYDNAATADRNSHYEVQQFTIPAAATKPTTWGTDFPPGPGAMSGYRYKETNHVNDAACAWMQSAYGGSVITACDKLKSGDTTFNAGLNTIDMTGVSPIDASAYSPGDWVCRIVSISLYRYNIPASGPGSSEPHRVTYPICVVIAKMPSVQIIGDDLHVGDGPTGQTYEKASVQTGSFEAGSALYGSWVEYGIFAPAPLGVIKSISGGVIGGPNGGTAGMTDDQKNGLSFANTASPYGNWSAPQEVASIEKMAANYPEEFEHGANINLNNKVGDNQIKRVTLDHAGGVKMSGDFTRQDAAAIFIYDGTVTIDGNINVTDKTINAIGKASQVVIIANQIIIKDNVENIDAWLVARSTTLADAMGVITTCNEIQSPYTKNLQLGDACSQHQLRINGAVIAKELQLRRTYGADKSLTNGLSIPAEILDLRADAYMWARSVNASGVFNYPMQTMFTTELPPRF